MIDEPGVGMEHPGAADEANPSRAACGRRPSRSPSDAGYSTVEAVLLLPILVSITLLVVQMALNWHARSIAESTARHGAQAARAYTATDADGLSAARTYLTAVDPTLLSQPRITVTRTATTVTVRIQARVLTTPGIPFTFHVDERSSAPIERFVSRFHLTP